MRAWIMRGRVMGLVVAACLAASVSGAAGIHCRPEPTTINVNPGDTIVVALNIFQADAQFNAFDASIRFDPSRVTFLPAPSPASQRGELMTSACSNSFHLFSAGPDSLAITYSLLCASVSVTGPGVVYRVKFIAGATSGETTISLGPSTQFYDAGFFANPLDTQPMTICIGSCATDVGPARPRSFAFDAPQPNPAGADRAGRFQFVLPSADDVTLELFDVHGRRVASRAAESFQAGPNQIEWSAPRLTPGVYVVRLSARGGASAHRLWALLR